MKQRWTLQFEQLGRIREGQVRIAPLMLLTGDNNAGKSYVMALLWGVIALGRDLFPESPPESALYQTCEQWLRERLGTDVTVGPDQSERLVTWFSEVLNHRRRAVCDAVFGPDRVTPSLLRITDFCREKPLQVRWDRSPVSAARYSTGEDYVRFPLPTKAASRADLYRMNRYLTWNLVMGNLSTPLFQMLSPLQSVPRGEILYLPAARTGFVLMRKALASLALGGGLADLQEPALELNLPTRRFLQRLVGLSHSDKSEYAAVAARLEADVLCGSLRPDSAPLPDYQYRPAGASETAIPLWLTSSLVTELAPLLMFLCSKDLFRSLIIEEPEAHLHLEVQEKLARALARLVNAGLPVWLTTHGDSFFQQFSNLIKASSLKPSELSALGIEQSETLTPDQVCGWHFKVDVRSQGAGRTQIRPLDVSSSGIAAAAFNETLARLARQTLTLNEHQEDDET